MRDTLSCSGLDFILTASTILHTRSYRHRAGFVHQPAEVVQARTARTSRTTIRVVPELTSTQAKDAHVGVVKAYALPPKPQTPALPSDLAGELAAYDASEPTKADVKPATTELKSDAADGPEAFLELLEADVPEPAHHH